LSHLSALSVEIIDWNGFGTRLQQNAHTLFRWFRYTRPEGLVPLDQAPERGTFRAYLNDQKLSYYSRRQHLNSIAAPPGVEILDEEALLGEFEDGTKTGLVISGSGGLGKTRLALELGRLARQRDWTVMKVQSRLSLDALRHLAVRIRPERPVLLVVDYVETQRDFSELVDTLNDLNETYSLQLRYVASCRSSYYGAVAATSRHKHVDLSPVKGDAAQAWMDSYQQQTVRHILASSQIPVTPKHLDICRNTPVLAVFLSYLQRVGRQPDLSELLEEPSFGDWVAKRIQMTFGGRSIVRELALLMALFPMTDPLMNSPYLSMCRDLLDKLATDGWIEKILGERSGDPISWVTAHDVLADQIFLSYLGSIPRTVRPFVGELFALARESGNLSSALISLQRLADQPQLHGLEWQSIFAEEMAEHPQEWREVRDLVMRYPLLGPKDRIALLAQGHEIWAGAELSTEFQNALGWIARSVVSQEPLPIENGLRSILVSWIQRAAPHAWHSNFLLTWGLRLCPDIVRQHALTWILSRPALLQTHYLMVAWLNVGLPPLDILPSVRLWASAFNRDPHLSFLACAWLNAKGDIDLVRPHIQAWLPLHATAHDTEFVYAAWLDAKGNIDLVRPHIEAWLPLHASDSDADFLLRAWLDRGGDFELVRSACRVWLHQHCTSPEAVYITQTLAKQPHLPADIVADILAWCSEFPSNEDALWRLTQLGKHLFEPAVSEKLCATAETVFRASVASVPISPLTRGQLATLFSRLIRAPSLRSGPLRERVDNVFLLWLRHPESYGTHPPAHARIQRPEIFKRVFDLVTSGLLDVSADREHLRRFLLWVNTWEPELKSKLRPTLDWLNHHHPPRDLWDIVHTPPKIDPD